MIGARGISQGDGIDLRIFRSGILLILFHIDDDDVVVGRIGGSAVGFCPVLVRPDLETLPRFGGNDGDVATELFKAKNGWEDDDGEDASDWVFQPGDSFWITPADDITVTIPAAI